MARVLKWCKMPQAKDVWWLIVTLVTLMFAFGSLVVLTFVFRPLFILLNEMWVNYSVSVPSYDYNATYLLVPTLLFEGVVAFPVYCYSIAFRRHNKSVVSCVVVASASIIMFLATFHTILWNIIAIGSLNFISDYPGLSPMVGIMPTILLVGGLAAPLLLWARVYRRMRRQRLEKEAQYESIKSQSISE